MITVQTNETFQAVVAIANTGNTTWKTVYGYNLIIQSADIWGVNSVSLPNDVPPNTTITFTFTVRAPSKAGTYDFNWGIAKNGVLIKGIYCAQSIQVDIVNVTTPTPTPTPTPTLNTTPTPTPTLNTTQTPTPTLNKNLTPTPTTTRQSTNNPNPALTPTVSRSSPATTPTSSKSPSSPNNNNTLKNNLVAYYQFDNPNNLFDYSCAHYNLSPVNPSDPPTYPQGYFNQCAYFNTSEIVYNAVYPYIPQITVAAWVKLDSTYSGAHANVQSQSFTKVETTTWTVPPDITSAQVFVVGGGGGGGAGGTIVTQTLNYSPAVINSDLTIPAGTTYFVNDYLTLNNTNVYVYGNLCINLKIKGTGNIYVYSGGEITINLNNPNYGTDANRLNGLIDIKPGAVAYGFAGLNPSTTINIDGTIHSSNAGSPCFSLQSATNSYGVYYGAGGGGGGVQYQSYSVTPGQQISVTVGDGGDGGVLKTDGSSGKSSSFGTIIAGGGEGGFFNSTGHTTQPAGGTPSAYTGSSFGGVNIFQGSTYAPGTGITLNTQTYAQGGPYGTTSAIAGSNGTSNTGNGGSGGGNSFSASTLTPIENLNGGKGGSGFVEVFYSTIPTVYRSLFKYSINGVSEYDFGFLSDGYTYINNKGILSSKNNEPKINDGQWHFVAFQVDTINGYMRYTIDGIEGVRVASNINSITNALHLVQIGLGGFQGKIDELAIWNTILTDSQLNQFANNPFSVVTCITPTPTQTPTVTPTPTHAYETVNFHYTAGTVWTDRNLYDDTKSLFPKSSIKYILNAYVDSVALIGASSNATYALTINNFPSNISINLINNGSIVGASGHPGPGGTGTGVGTKGYDGGSALFASSIFTLTNNLNIFSGAGGGGGGGGYTYTDTNAVRSWTAGSDVYTCCNCTTPGTGGGGGCPGFYMSGTGPGANPAIPATAYAFSGWYGCAYGAGQAGCKCFNQTHYNAGNITCSRDISNTGGTGGYGYGYLNSALYGGSNGGAGGTGTGNGGAGGLSPGTSGSNGTAGLSSSYGTGGAPGTPIVGLFNIINQNNYNNGTII
jgi:hypothetical protein